MHKISHLFSSLAVCFAFIILFGASPISASAANWCSLDASQVTHVFSSQSQCTLLRQTGWNSCAECSSWSFVRSQDWVTNIFPTSASCEAARGEGYGTSCRQTTSEDSKAITTDLGLYYGKYNTASRAFLFDFNARSGLLVAYGNYVSAAKVWYAPFTELQFGKINYSDNTGLPTTIKYCDDGAISYDTKQACLSANSNSNTRSCVPCQNQIAIYSTVALASPVPPTTPATPPTTAPETPPPSDPPASTTFNAFNTWCARDTSDVVHVFATGPQCTAARRPGWNICGGCTAWCSIGANKVASNVFPTNSACSASVAASGVAGGSCRQCTDADLAVINKKLTPYYGSYNPSSKGFLFDFNATSGLLLGYRTYGTTNPTYYSFSTIGTTPVPGAKYCGTSGKQYADLGACESGEGNAVGNSCVPCADQVATLAQPSPAAGTQPPPDPGTVPPKYCDKGGTEYPTLDACNIAGGPCTQKSENAACADHNANGPYCTDDERIYETQSDCQAANGKNCKLCSDATDTKGTNPPGTNPPPNSVIPDGGPFRTGGGDGSCNGKSGGIPNPLGSTCTLYDFLTKILKVLQYMGGVVITMAIIYSGFLFVQAQGNAEGLETAKRSITWTVIGAAVLLGSTVLSTIIQNTITQISNIK